MREHLPMLQVLLPLLSAPLCVVLRRPRPVRTLVQLVSWVGLAISISLLAEVTRHGVMSYEIGGWPAPWGIEYRVDPLNAFVLLIVSAVAAVVVPFGPNTLMREVPEEKHHLFLAVFMLCLAGLLGITVTGDAFNVFVFLEISSLSSYALISMGRSRRSLTAAYQYLIVGTIGSTFLLIGIGLMYMMTGTLNMADLAVRLQPVFDTRTVRAALAFLVVGISIKLALFPLHSWLPNAYTYAPSMVTAFLASTATKVSVYLLLRVLVTIFGVGFVFGTMQMHMVLLPLGLTAVVTASMVAMFQENVKRMLAFSSLAQIGYMVLGLSLVSVTGLTGSIVHLFNHALTKGALFLALGCVYYAAGSVELQAMRGIGRRLPGVMTAFVVAGLSLVGVPFTCGFISKWYLVLAALEGERWVTAALILVASLAAAVYVGRVIDAAFFCEPPEDKPLQHRVPMGMLVPLWIMTSACIVFGIAARVPVGAAQRAARFLLEGTP